MHAIAHSSAQDRKGGLGSGEIAIAQELSRFEESDSPMRYFTGKTLVLKNVVGLRSWNVRSTRLRLNMLQRELSTLNESIAPKRTASCREIII